ncbi:MAG: MG2 domain-containing protein [Candidatus Melainabacteria bacterium]|nr:MG2 domain-containing protein [Candidatus Melainabacteria bacterium]
MFTAKPIGCLQVGSLLGCVAAFFCLAGLAIALETPVGSLNGQLSLEAPQFNLSTQAMRDNRVYVLATGPRSNPQPQEVGVWVQPDGQFQFPKLAEGEYSLKIRAVGYETLYQHGIFVNADKPNTLKTPIRLAMLKPYIRAGSNTRLFTTTETPHFWINGSGVRQARIRIFHQPIEPFIRQADQTPPAGPLEFSDSLSVYRRGGSAVPMSNWPSGKPVQTLQRTLHSDGSDWVRADVKLNKPLPAGDYLAVVDAKNHKGESDWNALWFSVSDLGLIVKQDPQQVVVKAFNLRTLQPEPGVAIRLLNRKTGGTLLASTPATDGTGFAKFALAEITTGDYQNLLVVGRKASQSAYAGWSRWSQTADRYQTYFYTDKPVYRLGQVAQFKAMVRLLEPNGLRNPGANHPVTLTVEDPDGNTLQTTPLKTNAFGSISGQITLPNEGKTGVYQLTLSYHNQAQTYHRMEVIQYRKPEYEVTVQPLAKRVTAGQMLPVKVRANYYFGAPVRNAQVHYTVYESPDWQSRYQLMERPEHEDYFDDWDENDYGYGGTYLSEGTATTNDAGEVLVHVPTQASRAPEDPSSEDWLDKRYKVQVEVTDLSRMTVTSSANASVVHGDYALFLQPDRWVYKANEPMSGQLQAIDYDGKPVGNRTVSLRLLRWVWDEIHNTYHTIEALPQPVEITTNAAGRGQFRLTPKGGMPTDTYILEAKSQDQSHRTVYDQTSLWLANHTQPLFWSNQEAEKQPFSVKPDKAVYRPGEVARVMITAPLTGKEKAQALVTVEGLKLHHVQTVPLDSAAKLVEIPIRADYAPNVYVSVAMVGKQHQFYQAEELLKVSPAAHFLNIEIETAKNRYKPGDVVEYKLKATQANGQPAANTELSLGVVDESIYAIRPETARDIQKFFYPKRYNQVISLSSFPEEYSGGPGKQEPRVRKDFKDTAFWLASLVTNTRGEATAKVRLPDNLTQWRATVRGITPQTQVGSAIQKITASQDLMVRLALPRFFTQGDHGTITTVVHNETNQAQTVRLSLLEQSAKALFAFEEPLQQTLTLPANEAKRFVWHGKAQAAGQLTLQAKAVAQTASDAVENQLTIHPLGVPLTQASAGRLNATPTTQPHPEEIPVIWPANASAQTAQLDLYLAGSTLGPVLGHLTTLVDYPYGCTEQTVSRLMPAVVARQLHQQLQVSISNELEQKISTVGEQALQKLKDTQQADGSWGWWAYDSGNLYLTAYVLEGLYHLQQSGKAIDPTLTQRAAEWTLRQSELLFHQLADPKRAEKNTDSIVVDRIQDWAYARYVLSLYGHSVPQHALKWLKQQSTGVSPEVDAWVVLALKHANQPEQSRLWAERLQAWASKNRHGQWQHWDHTPVVNRRVHGSKTDYSYRFTGVETTAWALQAMLGSQAIAAKELQSTIDWLTMQRGAEGWDNTKTTALVLRSLMEEAVKHPQAAPLSLTATMETPSASPPGASFSFMESNRYEPQQHWRATPEQLISILKNRALTLQLDGTGELLYSQILRAWLPLEPRATVPFANQPEGLHVRRTFYKVAPKATTSDGVLHYHSTPLHNGTARSGDILLMKVELESPTRLPYLMINVPLPSGAEVLSNDPRAAEAVSSLNTEDWGPWWWSHQDVMDERVVYFASELPAGKQFLYALVRVEMPGVFQMNPVRLEGMYSAAIRAYSATDQLTVTE